MIAEFDNVVICDTIKQNDSEVAHSTFLVFYVAVLTIFNAMFSKNPMKVGLLVPEIQAVEGIAK